MHHTGKTWNNIALDADWIVRRCELCRSNSTREMGKADVRHLPTPLHAGDVIGWDLKTVTPHDEPKWSMLLALDFTSGKTWTWALDFGEATAVKVQELMLKFYADNELPAICWTDNGGQFRNLLTTAIEATLGVRPRTIPPGRPQANGLVECHNRLLDSAHAGQRSRLLAATVAVNSRIHQRYGVSPESLWRTLRPTESRWKNLQLRGIIHGEAKPISEADWLRFLDESEAGLTPEHVQQAAEALHKAVGPISGALNNKKMREAMKRHLRYTRKRTHRSTMPLVSGDRVIARNSQYTTKTGRGKFETLGGEVREFTVLSVSQGFVSLKDNKTGALISPSIMFFASSHYYVSCISYRSLNDYLYYSLGFLFLITIYYKGAQNPILIIKARIVCETHRCLFPCQVTSVSDTKPASSSCQSSWRRMTMCLHHLVCARLIPQSVDGHPTSTLGFASRSWQMEPAFTGPCTWACSCVVASQQRLCRTDPVSLVAK